MQKLLSYKIFVFSWNKLYLQEVSKFFKFSLLLYSSKQGCTTKFAFWPFFNPHQGGYVIARVCECVYVLFSL